MQPQARKGSAFDGTGRVRLDRREVPVLPAKPVDALVQDPPDNVLLDPVALVSAELIMEVVGGGTGLGLQAIDPRVPSDASPAIRIALQEVDIAVRLLARHAGLAA
jgi:hypothetical protein